MAQKYIHKAASLADIRDLPGAAGIGVFGGMAYVNLLGAQVPLVGGGIFARVYLVDGTNGSDTDRRLPYKTIQAAINEARYRGTGALNYTDKSQYSIIYVAPGHYNEQVLFSGYNIALVACANPAAGKDWGVSLNYDGAVAATAVLGFSGSGLAILGPWHVYCDAAIPAVYCTGGDNNIIDGMTIEGDGVNMTYAIHAVSLKGSWLRNIIASGFMTAGIYCPGGADQYAIHGGIEGCQLFAGTSAGAKGIYIHADATAYDFRIFRNFIDVVGGGATAKGIDNDAARILIAENYIVNANGATSIEDAGGCVLTNHSRIVSGTIVDPNPAAT
jgi:hypothetical protein